MSAGVDQMRPDEPSSRTGTGGRTSAASRLWTAVLVCAWAAPFNFAVMPGPVLALYVAVLASASLWMLSWTVRFPVFAWVVLALIVFIVFQALLGVTSPATPLMLAQILTGAAVFRCFRNPCLFAFVWLTCSTLVLVAEQFTHTSLVLDLFPATYFDAQDVTQVFRSRGFLGQPVPAGLIPVVLSAFVYVSARFYFSRRAADRIIAATIVLMVVSIVTSGTRSAILAAGLLVALLIVLRLRDRSGEPMWTYGSWLLGSLIPLGVLAVLYSSSFSSLRLFQLDNLEGTDSYTVRAGAWDVVSGLSRECNSCVVLGNGQGDLARQLLDGAALVKISTVDNQFLTAWWDFGLLGVITLAALAIFGLVFTFRRSMAPVTRGGGLAILIFVALGLFYVPIYLASGAMALGFMLAAVCSGNAAVQTEQVTP